MFITKVHLKSMKVIRNFLRARRNMNKGKWRNIQCRRKSKRKRKKRKRYLSLNQMKTCKCNVITNRMKMCKNK